NPKDWGALFQKAFEPMSQPEGSLVGKQPPAHPAPAHPLNTYVGDYNNPYWGPAKITERDGALQLSLGPRGTVFPLSHWDGDTFTFTLHNENTPDGTISKATFAGNTLTLEYYDDDKLGTFTRWPASLVETTAARQQWRCLLDGRSTGRMEDWTDGVSGQGEEPAVEERRQGG